MQATKPIIDALLASGLLMPGQLQHAVRVQSHQGGDLLQILYLLDYVTPHQVEQVQRRSTNGRVSAIPPQYSMDHRKAPTPHFPKGYNGVPPSPAPNPTPRKPTYYPSGESVAVFKGSPGTPPSEDLRDDLDIVFDPPTDEVVDDDPNDFSISLMQGGRVPSQAELSEFMNQGSSTSSSETPVLSSGGLFDTVFELPPSQELQQQSQPLSTLAPNQDATLHVDVEVQPNVDATVHVDVEVPQPSVPDVEVVEVDVPDPDATSAGHSLFDTAFMEEVPDFAASGVDLNLIGLGDASAEASGGRTFPGPISGLSVDENKESLSVVIAPPEGSSSVSHCPNCGAERVGQTKFCHSCCTYLSDSSEDLELAGVLVHEKFQLNGRFSGGLGYDSYHATDIKTQESVRIKLYPYDSRTPETLFRFQRRAEWLRAVSHPNLVPIVEVGVDPDWGGFVVEALVPATPLREQLSQREGFYLRELVPLFEGVANVLQECHNQNVYHCNLTLDSILIPASSGHWSDCIVADPSVPPFLPHGRALERSVSEPLSSRLALTPESSESHDEEAGVPGDLYRLGVVLFELLTGHPPFSGSFPLVLQLQHTDVPAPTLYQVRPDVVFPRKLQTLLSMSLEKEPSERIPTVMEWLTLLHDAVSHNPDQWVPTSWNAPSVTSMDRHIVEAAHELLRKCQRPTFREAMSNVGLFHHLSVLLRTPNIQSLQSVEEVMDSFVPSQELLAAGPVLSSEGWEAAPDETIAGSPLLDPTLAADNQLSYQFLPSAEGDYFRRNEVVEARQQSMRNDPTFILEENARQLGRPTHGTGIKKRPTPPPLSPSQQAKSGWTWKGALWLLIGCLFLIAGFLFLFK